MKVMKKIAAMMLAVCMVVPFISLKADAAEGTIMFSDPQTKVGENVSVDLVVQASGQTIGDVEITMDYDSSSLEFISGTEVEKSGDGTLTYSHTGTGSETELRTAMEFRALKQGEASITISGHTAYLYSDETLNLSEGNSVVTIDVGADGSTSVEPSGSGEDDNAGTVATTDIKVNVNGKEYSLSEAFTVAVIPEGYSETKLTYSGAERKFVSNAGGVKLGYLVDDAGEADFFLYNEEDATFAPFLEKHISETTSIILLNGTKEVSLPEQYQEADIQIGDYTISAWQDMEHDGYYAMYALNTATGKKEVYQYDTGDETYQKMIIPEKTEETEKDDDGSLLGKIKGLVNEHFLIFAIAAGVMALLFLIIIIVLGVKLAHRNEELDDLYEEYDIPDEEPEEKAPKKSRKQFAGFKDDDFDDEDDYLEDDYLEDDYDFEDDDSGSDDEFEDDFYESESDFEDDDFDDDDDDFQVDFIDL